MGCCETLQHKRRMAPIGWLTCSFTSIKTANHRGDSLSLLPHLQNAIFTASCPTRALTEVLLITPKVGELKLVSGLANCG